MNEDYRVAIRTKFVSPTNTCGPRIMATNGKQKMFIEWDHGKNVEGNHLAAAKAMREKMNWKGRWKMGWLLHEGVHVFVDMES